MNKLALEKGSVFFCPTHPTSLHKLLQIGQSLQINRPIVFLILNKHVAENVSSISDAGFQYLYISESLSTNIKSVETEPREKKTLRKKILQSAIKKIKCISLLEPLFKARQRKFVLALQQQLISEYELKKKEVKKVFESYEPSLMVSSSDRILGYLSCVLSEARARGIKIIIPPIAMISGSKEMAELRYQRDDDNLIAQDPQIKSLFPEQFYPAKNGVMVSFFPTWMLEPLNNMGVLPQSPWKYGESFADRLLVEGEFPQSRLIQAGVSKEKVVVVGDTELDKLYSRWVDHKENRETGQAFHIVIALPQLFEHNLLSFEDQWVLVNDICRGVSEHSVDITISLHPKMKLETYLPLEDRYSVKISREPLSEFLASADIFIASNGSSTWLWATLCGIPTVLCDWSGLNYDFIDLDKCGVTIIRDKKEYPICIDRLINDDKYYLEQKSRQLKGAEKLAMFDGKAADRISDLIDQSVSQET